MLKRDLDDLALSNLRGRFNNPVVIAFLGGTILQIVSENHARTCNCFKLEYFCNKLLYSCVSVCISLQTHMLIMQFFFAEDTKLCLRFIPTARLFIMLCDLMASFNFREFSIHIISLIMSQKSLFEMFSYCYMHF